MTKQDEWQNTLKYNKKAKTTLKLHLKYQCSELLRTILQKCQKYTASLLYLNILYVIFEIYLSFEKFYTTQLSNILKL